MIPKETVEQIQNTASIVEVIGEFVPLKRKGVNYVGCCPFHGEKTGSFTVSPVKCIYKCFGCGRSGSVITFLMEHEKQSYPEALRWLAKKYNIEVEEEEYSPAQAIEKHTAESLFALNNFANTHFQQQLKETGSAWHYIHTERQFSTEIIDKYQLGYNYGHDSKFSSDAITAQFNSEILLKSGLCIFKEEHLRDNYRDRIIFPVHNTYGKILGFAARQVIKDGKAPKYINTPENEIYIKGKILYGLYQARQAIMQEDECLLVEGHTDVLAIAQAGIENVVASGGTSLTTDQLKLIKKYTENLTIIYDADNAGIKAAIRGIEMAIEQRINLHLLLLPDEHDPDSFIRETGKYAFIEYAKKHKRDAVLFMADVLLKDADDDLNKKNKAANQLAQTISLLCDSGDFVKRQEYIKECAQLFGIQESGMNELVNKHIREKISNFSKPSKHTDEQPEQDALPSDLFDLYFRHECHILYFLNEHGNEMLADCTVAEYLIDTIAEYPILQPKLLAIFKAYVSMFNTTGGNVNRQALLYTPEHADTMKSVYDIIMYETEQLDCIEQSVSALIMAGGDIENAVFTTTNYYKLQKIKQMIEFNQHDMEGLVGAASFPKLAIHRELKKEQTKVAAMLGITIFK